MVAVAAAGVMAGQRLLTLGVLQRAILVARPSAAVRSPYVADIMLLADLQIERKVLQGIESLGTTELSPTKTGRKKQLQECTAYLREIAPEGSLALAHAPSLDCAGQALPGTIVLVSPNINPQAKTRYSIQLVERKEDRTLIGYHPSLAESLSKNILSLGIMNDEFQLSSTPDATQLSAQMRYSRSRFDFAIETDNELLLIEVKNVVCAENDHSTDHRHALFPIGDSSRSESGAVSERAIKHVHELTQLQGTSTDKGRRIRTAILFLVNRNDCVAFRPCHEADLLFAQLLQRAYRNGVCLVAFQVNWSTVDNEYIASTGSVLPLAFDSAVNIDEIDEVKLGSILSSVYDLEVEDDQLNGQVMKKRKR